MSNDFYLSIDDGIRGIHAKAEAELCVNASYHYVMLVEYLRPIYQELTLASDKKHIEDIFVTIRKI